MAIPIAIPPNGFRAFLTSPPPVPGILSSPHSLPPMVHPDSHFTQYQPMDAPSSLPPPPLPPCLQLPKSHKTKKRTGDHVIRAEQQPKKTKASSKSSHTADMEDDDTKGKSSWKDYWVEQLVHLRGGMNDNFNGPQKQVQDLWSKIAIRLASLYWDFDKDSEGCHRKWQRVYKDYKADKVHNSISSNDRKYICKWYDLVDDYMHKRAHVVCVSHASSIPIEELVAQGEQLAGGDNIVADPDHNNNEGNRDNRSTTNNRAARRSKVVDDALTKMASIGEQMLEHLRSTATQKLDLENRRLAVLEAFSANMSILFEKKSS